MIRGDPRLIEQVIVNLVENARDAMPMGGILRIIVGRASPGRKRGAPGNGDADRVPRDDPRVRHGTGMSEEARQHVFEPFYSTKGVEREGLGLATAWGIVQQHGGNVLIDSPPDGGTCVTVCLPGGRGEGREAARPCDHHA